ncbi:TPA: hypothetical protein KN209_000278 [Clostridioides difficile]|uniref:Membrane protein n=13 Tax=Clostridioides difficile TaxID=1496 RepID=Q18BP9_CLOD6|nr:hypothetical protein [Clostridioides difficile]EQG61453.1 hypothetical protein QK5_1123 [Clostridioides difficile DA00149]EQG77371.1 hypothetical protein QKA_1032 [Clostridioides difficile DA00165]EQK92732.1 hypothetical protein QEG_1229 [Clostridioides difficile CD127]OFU04083.1 hypothetical protein HMPREF3085_04045 [Clostridium sp. HMSC19E03]OFU09213.1 hypothetical protein HMPREF3083_02725 [Clostridium sp. HMSC19D07]OFU13833.1 hypothetical protein HMPREF3080_04520 [Clostridium sp. HMSC19
MGLRDKFAQSFARSKTMSGPEKKANEIMGKLLLKKAILPIVLMFVIIIAGAMLKINSWVTLGINLVIAVGAFFYIRNSSKKYQNFKPYVGNLISLEKKGKKEYVAIIKQGKLPVKLQIAYGGEDLEHVKKNQMVQISYNPDAKIAILVNRQ